MCESEGVYLGKRGRVLLEGQECERECVIGLGRCGLMAGRDACVLMTAL